MADRINAFRGRERFQVYLQALEEQQSEGGTVSPGGAAAILGVSRQRVHDLLREGRFRAWAFYERPVDRAGYVEIAVRDIVEHGVRIGALRSAADSGLAFPGLAEEIERARRGLG